MNDSTIYIKNMVCNRCIMAVEDTLQKLDIAFDKVELGKASLTKPIATDKYNYLSKELSAIGFEIIENEKDALVNKIKTLIIDNIHYQEDYSLNLSHLLSDQLHYEYSYLSKIFSEHESTTIEKFAIAQRIEKAKELISYGQLSLSEIADQLGYKTVQHLSTQFKKIMGQTPSQYKANQSEKRIPLDKI